MPRPALPDKPIEYIFDAKYITDAESEKEFVRLEIRTAREFQNFQYRLNLTTQFDAAARTITIRIGGVAVPAELMPGEGPAVGRFEIEKLKTGEYTIVVQKPPKDVNKFLLKVTKAKLAVKAKAVSGRKFIVVGA